MEAFLGRELGEQGARISGVLISWLWEEFAQCPEEADEEIVGYYCRAWILRLPAFSSLIPPVTVRPGCGSTASVTRTRRVTIAGALQSWVFYTGSCARGVVGLRP